MKPHCSICNGISIKPFYAGLIRCQACSHVFSALRLDEKEIYALYNIDYFSGGEYSNYIADRPALQKNFKLRLGVLSKYLDKNRHKHLLEIGCAYGFFLDVARHIFEVAKGIDIARESVRYAKTELKLDAIDEDFLKHNFENQKFDIVCMWDTIEHLVYPHRYLEKISSITESGALLAITTGDIKSIIARITKGRWRLIHPPTHMHYFSKKTLSKMLYAYGFDVIYNRYCGFYRSVDMTAYRVLVLGKKWPALYTFFKKIGLTRINFYVNLYDIMYVIARKRPSGSLN